MPDSLFRLLIELVMEVIKIIPNRSVVPQQHGQHSETPSLLKIQKLAGHGGMSL